MNPFYAYIVLTSVKYAGNICTVIRKCIPLQRKTEMTPFKAYQKNAKIAQLVEHNLAKVGVAGSSPVFRSNITNHLNPQKKTNLCPCGGIGRHATLRG